MTRAFPLSLLPALFAATPVAAQLRPLVEPPATAATAASDGVDVFLLNEGKDAAPVTAPDTLDTIARDGTPLKLELIRSSADTAPVAPGGFARLRYRLAPLAEAPPTAVAENRPKPAPTPGEGETQVADSHGLSSSFIERIRPYEPIYAAQGSGSSALKLQFSLAARPFGGTGLLRHLNLAYTQTFFLATNRPSGPITSVTYSPEVFYDVPVGEQVNVAFGYRHNSNGGGPRDSVDLNRIFVRVNKSWDLGHQWRIDLAPTAWVFVGTRGIATDIDRFYGNAGINASIARKDGVKLALNGRGDPASGRGAAEFFASYPLTRIGGDVGLYLFGQVFTGYGETLPGYNRSETRARLGFALTR